MMRRVAIVIRIGKIGHNTSKSAIGLEHPMHFFHHKIELSQMLKKVI